LHTLEDIRRETPEYFEIQFRGYIFAMSKNLELAFVFDHFPHGSEKIFFGAKR